MIVAVIGGVTVALQAQMMGLLDETIGYSTPRLGLVATFTIIVSAQFVVAALIDHFGVLGAVTRPLDLSRMLGIALLLAGIWLTMR